MINMFRLIQLNSKPFLEFENEKHIGEHYVDCPGNRQSDDQVCRFVVTDFGDRCTWRMEYGYDEGSPCIMVKLNRV